MNYPLLIIFGIAPSLIWLLFFLRKDVHPESNKMIIRVFVWGMIIAIPVALLEVGLKNVLEYSTLPLIVICFLGAALPEEIAKYLVVKIKVVSAPELDEPIDIMIYMIVAALGFSALENILMIWPFTSINLFAASWLRFITGTFLHVLTSGLLGYFLALSFLNLKKRWLFLFLGILIASLLHSAYNFFIIMEGTPRVTILALLILLSIFIFIGFEKVKKMKSICLY